MGGVDNADQMRDYYSTVKKLRKYWRYLLSFVFDASVNNAFILYDKCVTVKPKRHNAPLDFRLDFADQLIAGFSSRKKAAAKRKFQTVSESSAHLHKLVKFEGRKKACVSRKVAKRRTPAGRVVETSFGCDVCQVHFCKDMCFPQHVGAHYFSPNFSHMKSREHWRERQGRPVGTETSQGVDQYPLLPAKLSVSITSFVLLSELYLFHLHCVCLCWVCV